MKLIKTNLTLKLNKYDFITDLSTIYCLNICKDLLENPIYSFAVLCNRIIGNNIVIVDDNYILNNGITIKELYENDFIFNYIHDYSHGNIPRACDWLRLRLIEEYNFPVIMDLDCILYNREELEENNYLYHSNKNESHFLIKSQITRTLYSYLKLNYKMYVGDGSISVIPYQESIQPSLIGLSWLPITKLEDIDPIDDYKFYDKNFFKKYQYKGLMPYPKTLIKNEVISYISKLKSINDLTHNYKIY